MSLVTCLFAIGTRSKDFIAVLSGLDGAAQPLERKRRRVKHIVVIEFIMYIIIIKYFVKAVGVKGHAALRIVADMRRYLAAETIATANGAKDLEIILLMLLAAFSARQFDF